MGEFYMKDYILFSPVGTTDPTRGLRDGAFIHICRIYRPKKVYLYLSAEMCKFDELDNRYELYLNKLCKKLDFECKVKKIKKQELVHADDFDYFYDDFTKYVQKIIDQNPDSQIILNLSSGTPQMKSALQVIGVLSNYKLIPVQVRSPEGKSNETRYAGKDFDLEIEWELNEDNVEDFVNRCRVVRSRNLNALIKKEIMVKHIANYDYRAALDIVETIPDFISKEAKTLIAAGERRLALDVGLAKMHAQNIGYSLTTIKSKSAFKDDIIMAFEYILNLQVKAYRSELADFIRAISPILTSLFEIYLHEKCGINIDNYYKETGPKKHKTLKLCRELLPRDLLDALDNAFDQNYRNSEPSAAVLLPLIELKGEPQVIQLANELRDVEKEARNPAAHEIVSISDKWFKNKTGYDSNEILKMLKKFLSYCTAVPKNAWESYENLNQRIYDLLLIS